MVSGKTSKDIGVSPKFASIAFANLVSDKAMIVVSQSEEAPVVDSKTIEKAPQEITIEHIFIGAERVPAYWVITPDDENNAIKAVNQQTGRTFSGRISLFNKLLQGL